MAAFGPPFFYSPHHRKDTDNMDISAIKPASELLIDIVHPATEKPLGIKVSASSLDDEKMKKIRRRIQDDAINLQKKGKVFDAAQIDANRNLVCFSAMNSWVWEGDTTFHGEKPAFNQQTVYSVFNELPWFRDQIEEKVGDTKAFFQT
jgi:hypothetical protein